MKIRRILRKIVSFIILILLLILTGFFALILTISCDYKPTFRVKSTPDIVYFNIQNWNYWNRSHLNHKIKIVSQVPVTNISHEITLKDTMLIINWEFRPLNDSITEVRACVSDPNRKLRNRLSVLFKNTSFKRSVRNNLIDIKNRMESMQKTFYFQFAGFHRFEGRSCVYMNLKSTRRGKALKMMENVSDLNQFVRQSNLELDGSPFVVFHDWNENSDSITFDFCFPIVQSHIPEHPNIKYKHVESMDAAKTDFFGNYSISDITWYQLAQQAQKSGYQQNGELIEVYYKDPHSGGNELEWKAEIYLGLQSKK